MTAFKKGQLVYFHGRGDVDASFAHIEVVRQSGDYQIRTLEYSQCEAAYGHAMLVEPSDLSAVPIPEAPFKPGFYRDVSTNPDGRRILWFDSKPLHDANGGILWKQVNVTDA